MESMATRVAPLQPPQLGRRIEALSHGGFHGAVSSHGTARTPIPDYRGLTWPSLDSVHNMTFAGPSGGVKWCDVSRAR